MKISAVAAKTPRIKWFDRSPEHDIRYRGPLNYQHFQILGWTCIIVSQVLNILNIALKLDPNSLGPDIDGVLDVLNQVSGFSLPFLLVANFAQIINGNKTYKSILIRYAIAALGYWVGYALLMGRYVAGLIGALNDGSVSSVDILSTAFAKLSDSGILVLNIFMDLFLCTLVMFFLNYKPKKIFTGKSRIIFRLFALLPIAYEVFCMYLKVLSFRNEITVSVYLHPMFPVKPPMTFALFIVLVLYIKVRELGFRRHGKTHEEFMTFLRTNTNSLAFSIFLAIALVLTSWVDYRLMENMSIHEMKSLGGEVTEAWRPIALVLGFGKARMLWYLAPLVLLFSYTREPKKKAALIIPAVAIAVIAVFYIEALLLGLPELHLPKLNFKKFVESSGEGSITFSLETEEQIMNFITKQILR